MSILAYFVLVFWGLQSLVALLNLLVCPILKTRTKPTNDKLSILIPARNEAQNIGNLLNDLAQEPAFEILVYDDHSEDNSKQIIEEQAINDKRLLLLTGGELPSGWLGKNHACHHLAKSAQGDYLLFLDADVRVSKGFINSILNHSNQHHLALTSVFPQQIMLSNGERAVVPIMNFILLSLLPLFLVRRSKRFAALSAANGQVMLFKTETYRKYMPHKLFKNSKVEDIAIARYLKQQQHKTDCLTGNSSICCRMYHSYNQSIDGFTKNMAAFFGNSLLLAACYWLLNTLGVFLIVFYLTPSCFFLAVLLTVLQTICVSVCSRQSLVHNFLYHYWRIFSFGFIIFRALKYRQSKQYQWKGRYTDLS